jgi:hypothetical protein
MMGQDYPWYYYTPENPEARTRRIEAAALRREQMAENRQILRELLQRRLEQRERQVNRKKYIIPKRNLRQQ